MSISPDDLFLFAESLAGSNETAARAGVSRAYYGVYHMLLDFERTLPSSGVETQTNEGMHGRLYQRLLNPTVDQAHSAHSVSRRLAVMGRQLHGQRIRADYKLTETVTEADRAGAVAAARKIQALVTATGP